jgi:hypothetical protein
MHGDQIDGDADLRVLLVFPRAFSPVVFIVSASADGIGPPGK